MCRVIQVIVQVIVQYNALNLIDPINLQMRHSAHQSFSSDQSETSGAEHVANYVIQKYK